mmetsp:Transcript_14105/g.21104  ORF Transcript_14105/g.21104 Transcript_14105/m.21104 type:complete len:213 (-) Transcript_14105:105-743(-)
MPKRKSDDVSVCNEGEDTISQPSKRKPKGAGVPKTTLDRAVAAIRSIRSSTGSSVTAIHKYIVKEFGVDNIKVLKRALVSGVEKGILVKNKQSYTVAGDPEYEDTRERVEIQDITVGTGSQTVEKGCVCTIAYKGTLQSNGYVFDSGKSFVFAVGAGDVIKGMDEGVLGMSVGGRRKVVIPSSLGYGKRGSAPDIPGDADLVFDITLTHISE